MTIEQIYKLSIELGIKADLRNKEDIDRVLSDAKKEYQNLPKSEKEYFDKDKFFNPYSDTRIQIDKPNKKIKKVLTGIDINTGEVLLADKINADLIIMHHPIGKSLADGLEDVMQMQAGVLESYGLPANIAEKLLEKRISEVTNSVKPINHYQTIDAAKILNIGFINTHTVCDNLAVDFLKKHFEKEKIYNLKEALDSLLKIPEYREAKKMGFGPYLMVGDPKHRAGKIVITEMTGGTEGSKEIYEKMANVGIGTTVAMHMSKENKEAAEKANINVLVAGHISSDSLGMNLFLDKLEQKGIKIIPCSGLIRVKRKNTKN
ncbi:MAG: Nif3-like dinuclear metal center hexameric protein [Patescibacteria group bacterium]|jgi:hypothetical protein